jgi:hypothetical protein
MDFRELERAWQTQVVTGPEEPAAPVLARLKHELATARRRIRGGIALAAFVLFTGWTVSITAHLTSIKLFTPVALAADAVNGFLFAAFFVRAFRSAQAVQKEMKMMGGTLAESLSATLRTVELQMANARLAGYAIPIVVAINASWLVAKYFAGDIPDYGAAAGVISMVAFGAVIGAAVWHRYRTRLLPCRKELRETPRAVQSEF